MRFKVDDTHRYQIINSIISSIQLNSPFKVPVLYYNNKDILKGNIMQFSHDTPSADFTEFSKGSSLEVWRRILEDDR